MDALLAFLTLVVGCLTTYTFYHRSQRQGDRLPPGPAGLPLIGNILDIPKEREWITYREWGVQRASDIVYLNMAGTPMVVLNSRQAVHDLLDKKSSIYSDRPRYVMLNELCGFDWDFNFQGYGKEWKERRKLFTRELQPPKSLAHRNTVTKAIKRFLRTLVHCHSDELVQHLRHMAGDIILSIAYGIRISQDSDPYIALSEAGLEAIIKSATWGSYMVDYFPILRYIPSWMPGMGFKTQAAKWKKKAEKMVSVPFSLVTEERGSNKTAVGLNPSIASRFLDSIEDEDKESIHVLKDTLGAMYEAVAGADTTVSALSTFFLAMVLYPEVQRKGYDAIVSAIGTEDRLPAFSDNKSSPYIDAIVKEVLRWRPVTPLALPHRLTVNDSYNKFVLPAGSVVIGNTWAILHDKSVYGEDVNDFRPERFLKNNALDPDIPHPEAAFGFGRRACPGQDIAWSSMWLTVASVLFLFEITKGKDEQGVLITPSGEYTSGMQIYPKPFKCNIRLRYPGLSELLD